MFPFFTLISSLPFIFVFSTLLLSSYLIPARSHSPVLIVPRPTKLLPLPSTPRQHRYRTISALGLGQPRKLFLNLAKTVASTSVCVSVEQAPNDAARPAQRLEQPKAIRKKKKKKKKPKTVSFALENNTTQVVDRWIVKVCWARHDEVFDVDRWIEPHGRDQLHFPKTKFIRDGPEADAEDDEGDVEMVDA
ncbi:MAG: hypothetical protein ASARMPREDX12_002666 [Alectoria sarmentosa]|nr:MAG: hypothetical protein ASARMPREDX12_002666 [Alectoria sarmentosa]